MAWIKRSFGLKIFIFCWLLVFLIPVWRFRALRQYRNLHFDSSSLFSFPQEADQPSFLDYGVTPTKAGIIAERFPDEVGAQLVGMDKIHKDLFTDTDSKKFYKSTKIYFNHYKTLSKQFPESNLIRAQWLRDVTRGTVGIEARDNPQGRVNPPWISKDQMEAAIVCAREAARREPDNSFFPWMEAIFQFSLRRDVAGLDAIKRASRCSSFDDGTQGTVQLRLKYLNRVQSVTWEDELMEMWGFLLPHLARIRSASRVAMAHAKTLDQQGKRVEALEIASTIARAGRAIGQGKGTLITHLVGEGITQTAWKQLLERHGSVPQWREGEEREDEELGAARSKRYVGQLSQQFAGYARSLGRDGIARETLQSAQSFDAVRLSAAYRKSGFILSEQTYLARGYWVSAWLLRMAWYSAALYAMVWITPFLLGRDARLRVTPARRVMMLCAAFCLGVTGAMLMGALRLGVVAPFGWFDTQPQPAALDGVLTILQIFLWGLPILVCALVAARQPRQKSPHASSGLSELMLDKGKAKHGDWRAIVVFVVFGVNVTSWLATWAGANLSEESIWGLLWPVSAPLYTASIFATVAVSFLFLKEKTRFPVLLIEGVMLLIVCSVLLAYDFGIEPLFVPLIVTFWVSFMMFYFFLRDRFASGHYEGDNRFIVFFIVDVARNAKIAMGTLSVVGSIFYVLLAAALVPGQGRMHHSIQRQLQIGEVAFVKEQIAQDK